MLNSFTNIFESLGWFALGFASCFSLLKLFLSAPLVRTYERIYSRASREGRPWLLGGTGLFLSFLIFQVLNPITIAHWSQSAPHSFLTGFLITFISLFGVGLLDDIFEFRALGKLFLQILSIGPLAFFVARDLFSNWQILTFLLFYGSGLVLINSLNLMDGIDTVSARNASYTLIFYAFIMTTLGQTYVFQALCFVFGSLFSFYLLNKNPSKLYLGESGVGFISIIFLATGCLTTFLLYRESGDVNFAFTVGFSPVIINSSEAIISLVRRVLAGKFPLVKDQLHIHQILCHEYGLESQSAAKIIALFNSSIVLFLYLLSFVSEINFIAAWLVGGCLQAAFQLSLAGKFWFPEGLVFENITNLIFRYQERDKAQVIPLPQNSSVDEKQSEEINWDEAA